MQYKNPDFMIFAYIYTTVINLGMEEKTTLKIKA